MTEERKQEVIELIKELLDEPLYTGKIDELELDELGLGWVQPYFVLDTFPLDYLEDEPKNYCHEFTVERQWFREYLGRQNVEFEDFVGIYTWDWSYSVYLDAKAEGKIIKENEVL